MNRNRLKTILATLCMTVLSLGIINIHMPGSSAMAATVTGQVAGSTVNVRDAADQSGNKLGSLNKGDEVTILGEENGWYKIEYDEEVGFVSADYVEVNEPAKEEITEEDTEEDIEEAEAHEEEIEEEEEYSKSPLDMLGGNTTILIIVVVVVLLIIIILSTIISIRKLDDDDDYDDYDDDYDDYYDEDYDDYEEEEEYYEPAPRRRRQDRYEDAPVRREASAYQAQPRREAPVRPVQPRREAPAYQTQARYEAPQVKHSEEMPAMVKPDPTMFMSDNPEDYKIDIDPKYFEPTAMLPNVGDADAPAPIKTSAGSDKKRSEELAEAVKKMEELKQEIERIKSES